MRLRDWPIGMITLAIACGRVDFDSVGDATGLTAGACDDAIQNGDETGIDCGGSCPLACAGATCSGDPSCVTGHCVNGTCELATAPPFWLPGPALTAAREGLALATGPDGAIYAIGGSDAVSVALNNVDVLAGGAPSFVAGPPMTTARTRHAVATTLDGTIVAFAGSSTAGDVGTTEAFTGSWSPRAGAATAHAGISGVGGLDGKMYVVDVDGLWIYSPSADSWATVAPPTMARDSTGVARAADGAIYAIGGRMTLAAVDAVDSWSTSSLSWTPRAPLAVGRSRLAATLAPDGRIYAVAGLLIDSSVTNGVEAYTPGRDRWTTVSSLATPRALLGVTTAASGRIVAAGGYNTVSGQLASVELYGPVLGLSSTSSAPGTSIMVFASNFAANAPIAITLDNVPLALGVTDTLGTANLTFVVPAVPAGTHVLVAVDDRSQYPVSSSFSVR